MMIVLSLFFYQLHLDLKIQEFSSADEVFLNQLEKMRLEYFERETEIEPTGKQAFIKDNTKSEEKELFYFDPNTASLEDFLQLGLTRGQAGVIINFREKGGTFNEVGDISKIYSITPSMYEKLKPYIKIAQQERNEEKTMTIPEVFPPKKVYKPVEINSVTHAELKESLKIPGYLAERVIKYRELLGGFSHPGQFGEIYGIDDNSLEIIKTRSVIDTALLRKINLAGATEEELAGHPYLSRYQAQSIIRYKKIQGEIVSLFELLENNILDSLSFKKVTPYIYIGR